MNKVKQYNRISFYEFNRDELSSMMEKAKSLNVSNRKIDPNYVKRYAKDMENGNWNNEICSSPMLIKDGAIVGGQHRGEAALSTSLDKFVFPCIMDATEEEISFQDLCKNRTQRNNFEMIMSKEDREFITSLRPITTNQYHTSIKVLAINDLFEEDKKSSDKAKLRSRQSISPHLLLETARRHKQQFDLLKEGLNEDSKIVLNSSTLIAAFILSQRSMETNLWNNLVVFLQDPAPEKYEAGNKQNALRKLHELITNRYNRSKANNASDLYNDLCLYLSCLAAIHTNSNIDTVAIKTFGLETFVY